MDLSNIIRFLGFGLFSKGHALQAAVPGILLGILFHITIPQMVHIEYYVYQVLAGFLLAIFGLGSIYSSIGFSSFDILKRMLILAVFFNAGLFSSMVIYRLFFHRLRRFPGPLDTNISRIFSMLKVAKRVQYYKDTARMHEKYGDFIRTGPRELCIMRKSAVPIIYGPSSKCFKGTWYASTSGYSKKTSVVGTRDVDDHRRRRRAWDRSMSTKALQSYEPRVEALVDIFISQIYRRHGPMDVSAWSMYLTFDIIGEVGLGDDFRCVSTGIEHLAIKGIHNHMKPLAIMSHVPWLFNFLARIPGLSAGFAPFFDYCRSTTQEKLQNFDSGKEPRDIMSWLVKAVAEKDISAPPTREALDDDARTIIIAGSDTSSSTLAAVLFYFVKFPSVLKKAQAQVDALMPTPESWDYGKVKSITYIDNIIDEALRLKPAVRSGLHRETPQQGIQIDEEFIPGGIEVVVPTMGIQTDPRYWKQATEFIPERFGERFDEMGTAGAPYMPFSTGTYSCAGKNLAMMSLRIAISKVIQHFDISFALGETGEEFDNEALDTFTTIFPPLMLQFSRRQ